MVDVKNHGLTHDRWTKLGNHYLQRQKKKNSFTKFRETIKSVGQTAGHGAVKGYVNSSVPLHFCHAGRSLSTGPLPPSPDLTEAGRLGMCHAAVKM